MVIVIVFILFSMRAGTRCSLPNCIEVDQIAVSNAIQQVMYDLAVEHGALLCILIGLLLLPCRLRRCIASPKA